MSDISVGLFFGTANEISSYPVVDGQLLFETDQGLNGKIFLDADGVRKQAGGNYMPLHSVTFLETGWSTIAPFTQTVTVAGITSDYRSIPTLNQSGVTNEAMQRNLQLNFNYIMYYDSNNGSITATAPFTKPNTDITVNFVGQ